MLVKAGHLAACRLRLAGDGGRAGGDGWGRARSQREGIELSSRHRLVAMAAAHRPLAEKESERASFSPPEAAVNLSLPPHTLFAGMRSPTLQQRRHRKAQLDGGRPGKCLTAAGLPTCSL